MRKSNTKILLFLCTLTMLNSITKISAMENNKKNQNNLNNLSKITEKQNQEPKIENKIFIDINKKLKEFEIKFSKYSKDLIALEAQLLLNTEDNKNIKLEQIKNSYEKQKEEIKKTITEYKIFLEVNSNEISQNKDELLYCSLTDKISKNISKIENKIKNIDEILDDIDNKNVNEEIVEDSNEINENKNSKDSSLNENLNKINENKNSKNSSLNENSSSDELNNNILIFSDNDSEDEKEKEEEKKFVINKLMSEVSTSFASYVSMNDNLCKLKDILKNSICDAQDLFIEYINSIEIQPIEKIFDFSKNYEKKSSEIKELIKSYNEFKEIFFKNLDAKINNRIKMLHASDVNPKNFLIEVDKIINLSFKIDIMINDFAIFDSEKEKYVYYSFLKKSNKKNYGKNKPDVNIAKLYGKVNDIDALNSIIEKNINFNKFSVFMDIPNITKKFDIITTAENEIDLATKNKEKDQNNLNVKSIEKYAKEVEDQYEKTLKYFIELLQDINNDNKFYDFEKQNEILMDLCRDNNTAEHIGKENIKNFTNTIKILNNIQQILLMQKAKVREARINSYLKSATDNFFKLHSKIKENIKTNKEEIITKNDWKDFTKIWNEIRTNNYFFEIFNRYINKYVYYTFKNFRDLKMLKENINELTLILNSINERPFINLLVKKFNSKNKIFNNFLFDSQVNAYLSKLKMLHLSHMRELINMLQSEIFEITPTQHCNIWTKIIEEFNNDFNIFLNNYSESKIPEQEQIDLYQNIMEKTNVVLKQTNKFIDENLSEQFNSGKKDGKCDFKSIFKNALKEDIKTKIIDKIKENKILIKNIINNKNNDNMEQKNK